MIETEPGTECLTGPAHNNTAGHCRLITTSKYPPRSNTSQAFPQLGVEEGRWGEEEEVVMVVV